MFKNTLILFGLIILVSSIETGNTSGKYVVKEVYETPKEVVDELNKLIRKTEQIKTKMIRAKNNKQKGM